jgi:DNA damage-binding protein 1
MITFDSQAYVFVSLADGPIICYLLDIEQGLLYERKKVPLGTKPTTLTICHQTDFSSISTNSRTVLFACSDHPSVISSSNNKIVFSSVNLREIVCMCSFNSEYYGSSLTLVTDMGVLLGRIDDIQKLHVRSLGLGESARRILYMDEEKIYIILTQYMEEYQTDRIIPISKQAQQKIDCPTKIKTIEELTSQRSNDVCNSIVILDQHTHEGEELESSFEKNDLNISAFLLNLQSTLYSFNYF